jgi:TRAP-type C4-dicarboxylate transport system permease large subunit
MILVVVLAYGWLIDTWINEHTAPLILPGILLMLVILERWFLRPKLPEESDQKPLWPVLVSATQESSFHIGALLMVMAASVGLGGVVERAELMNLFPSDFGSPVGAMAALVLIMVLVGMTMDALGAVVLVSVTLAGVAYSNGIDAVHFWMMVLVAFELGYLTPPVAIDHLLARQVIGPEAAVENDGVEGFWLRTEHLWLPMLVMSVALLLVAFVPFMWYE